VSTRSPAELRELLADAEEMPEGEAQVSAVQDIVRWAEAAGLLDLEIQARLVLVDALMAIAQGAEDVNEVITAFTRVVAHYSARPDAFDDDMLDSLWRQFAAQGIVLSLMVEYPLRLVRGVCDDMERRCRPDRDDLHTVHSIRLLLADVTGDRDAGDRALAGLRHRDAAYYACAACLATFEVRFLAGAGRDAEAIAAAAPILTGELACDTEIQPADVLHILQTCYLRTGDLEEARDAHRRAYRGLDHEDEADLARHLVFCVLSGNTERALSIVKRDLPMFEGTPTVVYELELSAAAAMVFGALVDEGRGDEVLFWPANPDYADDEDQEWTFAELSDEFTRDALELAERYDERHGTTHIGDRVRATIAGRPIVDGLPLSAVAARRREIEQAAGPATAGAGPGPAAAPGEDPLKAALQYARRGDELLNSGRPDQAIGEFIEAAARLTALGEKRLATHARVDLATSYATVGRALDAAECAEEALPDIVAEDDAEYTGMQARWVLAGAYPELGQPGDALGMLGEMAERTGSGEVLARLDKKAGAILTAADRDGEAAQRYTAAAERYAELGDAYEEAVCLRQAALARSWAGDLDAALALADRSGGVAERFPEGAERGVWETAVLRYDRARILATHGRLAEAAAEAARAAETFRATSDRAFVTRCELMAGRLLYDLDDLGGAERALRRALAAPGAPPEDAAEREEAAELLADIRRERGA
jgi:tetratricopeptide (TPR) repeat protein